MTKVRYELGKWEVKKMNTLHLHTTFHPMISTPYEHISQSSLLTGELGFIIPIFLDGGSQGHRTSEQQNWA